MHFLFFTISHISGVSGHLSARYETYPGYNYIIPGNDWYLIRELDSIGDCANICTYTSCNLFKTQFIDGSFGGGGGFGSSFRGFKCFINVAQINQTAFRSPFVSNTMFVWLPKNTVNTPRTVASVSPSAPTAECPIVYGKLPTPELDYQTIQWTAFGRDPKVGVPPTYAFDGDNTTAYVSKVAAYPYFQIDMGRSQRVTKVSILASFTFREDPLVNLEVKVGARSVKSPIDDSSPPPSQVLFGNTRCGVFYGPNMIANQWIEIDCGYKNGIVGRYITFQLLDRVTQPSKLKIKEIEVEGFGRSCGRPCLQKNADNFLGPLDGNEPTDWRLVRYVPQRAQWHDANDKLMGTHSYGTAYDSGNPWSITWSWDSYDEFLFKVGSDWIIIDKKELLGNNGDTYYNVRSTKVIASSEQCDPHEVIMSRNNNYQEPLVYLTDQGQHHEVMMYAADRRGTNNRAPAEVYIRRRSVAPSGFPGNG